MKKVTLTDLNGKEIEVYFADNKTVESVKHSDAYDVKIEDVPSDKNWFDMTGGNLNEMDVNENSAWCGAGDESCGEKTKSSFYEKLNEKWLNKVKQLEGSGSQIRIDDSLPSDFVQTKDLRNGAIYKVAGLSLVAKLVDKDVMGNLADTHEVNFNPLLKMSRHGTIFYVEQNSLMKATDWDVERYLNEPF